MHYTKPRKIHCSTFMSRRKMLFLCHIGSFSISLTIQSEESFHLMRLTVNYEALHKYYSGFFMTPFYKKLNTRYLEFKKRLEPQRNS